MINNPLFYLIVERIKQLNSPGILLEETDLQLNLLDHVLFHKDKSKGEINYKYTDYENQLIESYLYLDKEDYQAIGIEANVWFLKLIHDHITKEKNDLMNSESITRFAYLYVTLEHPYCRYLLMMIYSNLSDMNCDLKFNDFINKIWTHYKSQNIDEHLESHKEYVDEDEEIFKNEIETILEDIKIKHY